MYAWKFHRRDKFVIQSVTGGIKEYMECLKKFRIGARLTPRPIRNFFRPSIYSCIPPVTDSITNSITQMIYTYCRICHTRGRHGRDRKVVEYTTTYAIIAYHNKRCEFEPRSL